MSFLGSLLLQGEMLVVANLAILLRYGLSGVLVLYLDQNACVFCIQ